MLKYALLGFLNYQPMTGYELENFINASTGYFWHAKLSQIYTTLKQLEQGGYLSSKVEIQEGRPDRRVYTITETGREDLHHWLAQPLLEADPVKSTLLLKLFFARPIGKQAILTQLRLQLDLHTRQGEEYQQMPSEGQRIAHENPQLTVDALLWEATLRFGQMYEVMYVAWLEETITRIERDFPDES